MKKIIIAIIIIFIAAYGIHSGYLLYLNHQLLNSQDQQILLVYNKSSLGNSGYILKAYESVLSEEGIPVKKVEIHLLTQLAAGKIASNSPAIIFPDSLLQNMPEDAMLWTKDYLNHGGSLAVIYDAGIRQPNGSFREKALLADITGVNYMTFNQYREKAYTKGQIKFNTDADAAFFQIPPGKTSDDFLLSGYAYGGLNYPVARAQRLDTALLPETVIANSVTSRGEEYPAIVLKKYGQGNVLYINLPLGYLKAYSDDLPLRVFLRTFLFHVVRIPHLVNVDEGIGKLVINWHIDSNIEWQGVTKAIDQQYLDKTLRSSMHITAGDFRDEEGDGLGFDACGRGKEFAEKYLPYGLIGSHGGWAHNWFSEQLDRNQLSNEQIEHYINKNKTCLEIITKYPLLEYSAPNGVHPQPVMTKVLENLGFNSYYYTGDSGSAPNRTFFNGKMVSEQVIAFPVLPNGKTASLYEMKKAKYDEKSVEQWLMACVDYVIDQRTTRLFYSHPYDVDNYPQAARNFLQYAKRKQDEGKLRIEPMSDIAKFFQRFIKTQYTFKKQGNGYLILLKNPEGLKGITVAIPRNTYRPSEIAGIRQSEDKHYHYLTVQENVEEKNFLVDGI